MAKTLLLVSTHPQDQIFAEAVAETAGLNFKKVQDPREAGRLLESESEPPVIFVDASTEVQYRAYEDALQQTVGLFSDKIAPNMMHFLTSSNLEDVQYLVQSQVFGHFIHRESMGDDIELNGKHYGLIVKATTSGDQAFGLNQLLKDGTKTQQVVLKSSTQKQDAVEAVKNFALAAKFQSRMAAVIANAVDELLMNAMYDAPVDSLGKPIHATTPRSAPLSLLEKNTVEMHVGYDGNYLAVSAVDYYGSLDKVKLMSHISKIYTEEEYKIRTSVAGAGIGLATVFRSGGSFLFVSDAQTKTEVTVFFKRTSNFRQFKDQFRFISTQFYF